MQRFQELLSQAAQLKEQQLKQQRKNFQALPQYLKSGLNYAKKYIQLRKQNYLIQKCISQKVKKQGNDHYLLQNYGQSLSKYQQALSVFRYIRASKYENLKDEDIIYQNYIPQQEHREDHRLHLVALYLNICSALTKMNKRDEAVHSAEQALQLDPNNPKAYYKKAHAYLQYINRQTSDVKIGFFYLNKAYELSKDMSILTQMHRIKKQLDQQRDKEKKWFKFMFDKSKQIKVNSEQERNNQNSAPIENNPEIKSTKSIKQENKGKIFAQQKQNKINQQNQQSKLLLEQKFKYKQLQPKTLQKQIPSQRLLLKQTAQKTSINPALQQFIQQIKSSQGPQQRNQSSQKRKSASQIRSQKFKKQFDLFCQQNEQIQEKTLTQIQKLEKSKITLKPYLIIPRDDRWLIKYQQDFIHKNGSKFYSILQLYNYSEYLAEFKSLLAKCLELKQGKITPERDQNTLLNQKISMYSKFVEWIKKHPVEKYKKYIERYDIQTHWINTNRGRPLDQVFVKEENKFISNQKVRQKQNKSKLNHGGEMFDDIETLKSHNGQIEQSSGNFRVNQDQKIKQLLSSVRQSHRSKQNNTEVFYQSSGKMPSKKDIPIIRQTKNKFFFNKIEQNILNKQDGKQKTKKPSQFQLHQLICNQKSRQPITKSEKNKQKNKNTYGFKQQWECDDSGGIQNKRQQQDQVPADLKGFLQNYQDFPSYQEKLREVKKEKEDAYSLNSKSKSNTLHQQVEDEQTQNQNPFGIIKTFVLIMILTLLVKLIF